MSYVDLKPIQGFDYASDKQQLLNFIHSSAINYSPLIRIDLSNLQNFNAELYLRILMNAEAYIDMLYECFDDIFYNQREILFSNDPKPLLDDMANHCENDDNHNISPITDVFMYHRINRAKEKFPDKKITELFPGNLLREYELIFEYQYSTIKGLIESISGSLNFPVFVPIRMLRSNLLGSFILTRGIVTKTHNIVPSLVVGTYICDGCGSETYQSVNASFVMLKQCYSDKCKLLKIRPTLSLQVKASKFVSQMECFLSECLDDVPASFTPKIIKLVLKRGFVKPGDVVYVSGVLGHKDCFFVEVHSVYNEQFVVQKRTDLNVIDMFRTHALSADNMQKNSVLEAPSAINKLNPNSNSYTDLVSGPSHLHSTENLNTTSHEFHLTIPHTTLRADQKATDHDTPYNVSPIMSESTSHDISHRATDNDITNPSPITSQSTSHNLSQSLPIDISKNSVHEMQTLHHDLSKANLMLSYCSNNSRMMSFIDSLVGSFAPEIYGLTDIKKILLLTLVGSTTQQRGLTTIRGNINTLLIGDPGTAKSQLLKTIQNITKCIYTTGTGSSGAGLTASITKIGNEFVLEAGALVLSDNSVCCIDELDKMSIKNRITIHETMEQQSVSISKAGVNCTLNARVTLVAAANPIHGFFREDRSLEWNIGLPVSLLSRFDCICVIKDNPIEESDYFLAQHVTQKRSLNNDKENVSVFDYAQLNMFINHAKTIEPVLNPSTSTRLLQIYLEKRKEKRETTPRLLLSLLRFAIAHAKLRLSGTVEEIDIEESIRLITTLNHFDKINENVVTDITVEIYKFITKQAINKQIHIERVYQAFETDKNQINNIIQLYSDAGALILNQETIILR